MRTGLFAHAAASALASGVAAALVLQPTAAHAEMTVEGYMTSRASPERRVVEFAVGYLAGVLDGIARANEAATTVGRPLFCPDAGEGGLHLEPVAEGYDQYLQIARGTRPDFSEFARSVSVGATLLVFLSQEYPCEDLPSGVGAEARDIE
jgi:hypothetical protein